MTALWTSADVPRPPAPRKNTAQARRRRPAFAALVVTLSALGGPAPAWAQRTPAEKAAAETLFDRGIEQLRTEDLSAACTSFEQSQRIDPAVGTLLYLAECYERTGRTASAWATFREAASLARELRQTDRAELGDARAKALEPNLARLVIKPPDGTAIPGLTMERDGQPVSLALLGVPTPIDPGEHTLLVAAPGYVPWQRSFVAAPGPSELSVEFPALTPLAEPPPPPEQAPVAGPSAQPADAAAPPLQPAQVDRTPVWILGGVGLAALGGGVFFGLRAQSLDDDAAKFCEGERCWDREGETLSNRARTSMLLANVGFGIGAAAVIAGGVLWFLDEDPKDAAALPVALTADASAASVQWRGSF